MVRVSLLLTGSFLVFWISVLGSTGSLHGWRAAHKALTPQAFELLKSRASAVPSPGAGLIGLANTGRVWTAPSQSTLRGSIWAGGSSSKCSTVGRTKRVAHMSEVRPMSSLLARAKCKRAVPERVPARVSVAARREWATRMSRPHWLPNATDVPRVHGGAQYRKRALALRRASGRSTRTLVAPEELTASAILPEEPNGVTLMIAISTVLVFATFAAS
ncbi:hypothetical protein IW139_001128 [Coemansia sp. RSA 353]|nr:hypothetical protein LPJ62_002604 [Coemansia sp. RSA 2167]KAJ2138668.1 hypothetical protein GGH17_001001 [Coemansia sp. RSA 788]KAJ2145586.1 hypothetical protein IW142_002527 [Coemansia sp. RSA 564]KAJ2164578.1 hypothetical protein GGH15_003856 [Coemansia sp. RSA 562]KAJ2175533.1 hypothetical protein GGH16_000706 [Coemansia sp. RSA 560]KAJ2188220.1 hypothetical protein EV181_002328 [Coemansia sp. RSA 532]KAJ2197145.1 hypothetical protein IW144_002569 [Coemansia sp. RSA 522]KAJ2198613.1 hy